MGQCELFFFVCTLAIGIFALMVMLGEFSEKESNNRAEQSCKNLSLMLLKEVLVRPVRIR